MVATCCMHGKDLTNSAVIKDPFLTNKNAYKFDIEGIVGNLVMKTRSKCILVTGNKVYAPNLY